MIFSELYSAYYATVAALLTAATEGKLTEATAKRIVSENAFSESGLSILPSLRREKWQLLRADLTTPIRHVPTCPLTLMQKRWLKAILLDPRMRLFEVSFDFLADVEPLFTPDDYQLYDSYADGDPFDDPAYIERFRTICRAIRTKTPLLITTLTRQGRLIKIRMLPTRLEYSEKDRKFRIRSLSGSLRYTVNLGRIRECVPLGSAFFPGAEHPDPRRTAVFEVFNERNSLERVLLHFAHFEKRAERTEESDRYLVTLRYHPEDETELVIRLLSFGPHVRVIESDALRELMRERIRQQKRLWSREKHDRA